MPQQAFSRQAACPYRLDARRNSTGCSCPALMLLEALPVDCWWMTGKPYLTD